MKILYLEDHEFYAVDILKLLRKLGHEVFWCKSYKEFKEQIENQTFDCSILDMILQNGKTGLELAETYSDILGRIMFLTGCVEKATLDTIIDKYPSANKMIIPREKIKQFLDGGYPKISNEEDIIKLSECVL